MSEREWRFYLDDMLSFAENVVTDVSTLFRTQSYTALC